MDMFGEDSYGDDWSYGDDDWYYDDEDWYYDDECWEYDVMGDDCAEEADVDGMTYCWAYVDYNPCTGEE
jgi:hypothetical protein